MLVARAALHLLCLNMQHACISAGGQVQASRTDPQIERIGAGGSRIAKKNKNKLTEQVHAAAGSERTVARKGGKGPAVVTSGNIRRWNVVPCPIRQSGRGTGKVGVLINRSEKDGQHPFRGNGDGRTAGCDAAGKEWEIYQSRSRRNCNGAVQRGVQTYARNIGIQLSVRPRGNQEKDRRQREDQSPASGLPLPSRLLALKVQFPVPRVQ